MAEVDYDEIAEQYDERYGANGFDGVRATLIDLAAKSAPSHILEVGCGTGHWIKELCARGSDVFGVDASLGMLRKARKKLPNGKLVCANAARLPFDEKTFDLIYCVNAFHHFQWPRVFLAEARRILRSGGTLAIVGLDPHRGKDRWYIYDFFPETREYDLVRFPSTARLCSWMSECGFSRPETRQADRLAHQLISREVLSDPTLKKNGTSQLALLTDEEYAAGMDRLLRDLDEAEAHSRTLSFVVDVSLWCVTGKAICKET